MKNLDYTPDAYIGTEAKKRFITLRDCLGINFIKAEYIVLQ